jgi:hypothetical protein
VRARRARALATVVVLAGGLAAVAAPASGDAARTTTGLGGFSIAVNAAPFKVLLDDPANPLPRPVDAPIAEADPSFTSAELGSGPVGHGIASSLWPGQLLGQGLNQVAPGAPAYPVQVNARYPDKPFTAQDQSGGTLMRSTALGLDVSATASLPSRSVPGTIEVGPITSTSVATVDVHSVAIGRASSSVADVSLLAGIIKVGAVTTTVETRSDGKHPTSSGSTVVSGLTVAGQGYVVDDQGARPVGAAGGVGSGPLPAGVLDPAKAAGITIAPLTQTTTKDADSLTRDASGLQITVDTTLLRSTLSSTVPSALTSALYGVFAQAPAQVRGYLFYSLATTPKITFLLGASHSTTAANLPLTFSFPPDLGGGLGLPPPGGAGSGPVAVPAGLPGGGPVTSGSALPPTRSAGQPPAVADPVLAPAASSQAGGADPFHGVSPLLLLGAALLAGLAGWGLQRLQALAIAGAVPAGCALGAPSDLPDLRGA